MKGIMVTLLGLVVAGQAHALATTGVVLTNLASCTFATAPTNTPAISVSYGVTATVLVQNPVVVPSKTATPTLQAAGSEVTFQVCVVNTSATASAFNVFVNDRLPDNMEWAGLATTYWNNSNPAGTWSESSSSVFPGPYVGTPPVAGQEAPYYMRWNLNWLGPLKSGCVTFKARIL